MLSKTLAAITVAAVSAVAANSAHAALAYGLTDNNFIVGFDTVTPSASVSSAFLRTSAGASIQDLIGIDYRPSTGVLYGVGIGGAIYTINPLTGVATTSLSLKDSSNAPVTLGGSRFGFDFNPTNGLLRITNNADQSYAVDVTTGIATLNVNPLNFGTPPGNPTVVGSAYSNNVATLGGTTTLYAIDSVTNALYTQNTTSSVLTYVGQLNFDITAVTGFDITTVNGVNTGYAVMQRVGDGASEFFTINLLTGAAQSSGTVADGDIFDGLAVTVAVPEPTTLAAVAGIGALALRRRRQA